MARVMVGTSGWHYESWRGPFFPKELPLKKQLEHYSEKFETTELNGVFYRTCHADGVTALSSAIRAGTRKAYSGC